MRDLYIENVRIYQNGAFAPGSVLCRGGRILAAGKNAFNDGAPVLDGRGMRLVPGFIDLHTHGAAGVDVNAADADGLRRIGAFFATQGTTAWNASVLTDTEERTLWCIENIKAAMAEPGDGAALLGVHLEGPFLSAEYKGAMPEYLLQKGDAALFRRDQQAAQGAVKYITVSPEVEGVNAMIREISGEVVVAIGHSGADYDTAMTAIQNGAR